MIQGSEPLEGTVEQTGTLIKIFPENVQTIFTEPNALDPLLAKMEEIVGQHVPDVSTATGRAAIAALAFKVAKTKTYLEKFKDELNKKLKAAPKMVDENWRVFRDRADALRDHARQALTDWEAEQDRIAAEKEAEEEAKELAKQIEIAHEFGIFLNAKFDADRAEALRKAEQDRQAEEIARKNHEAQIAQEAAEKATREAEAKAKSEQEASARREAEAVLAKERAERKMEDNRRAMAEREAQAIKDATERERKRQEDESARAKAEQEKRERDIEHRRTFNKEALKDMKAFYPDIPTPDHEAILKIIISGKIRHISMNY